MFLHDFPDFVIRLMCLVCPVSYHAFHISRTVPPVKLRFPLRAFPIKIFNGNPLVVLFNIASAVFILKVILCAGCIRIPAEYPFDELRFIAHGQFFCKYFI